MIQVGIDIGGDGHWGTFGDRGISWDNLLDITVNGSHSIVVKGGNVAVVHKTSAVTDAAAVVSV